MFRSYLHILKGRRSAFGAEAASVLSVLLIKLRRRKIYYEFSWYADDVALIAYDAGNFGVC